MRLVMVGLNHRTAELNLREQVTRSLGPADQLSADLHEAYPNAELVVLSTCNRLELYLARPTHNPPTGDQLTEFLAQRTGVDPTLLRASLIQREQDQAATHLFRVATGLDSMVLGEAQILGQVRRAYDAAREARTTGAMLHKLFQEAISAARRIRSEVGLDEVEASVGSAAVLFSKGVFDHFSDKTVLAIGAGEIVKASVKRFLTLEPKRIRMVNRTLATAHRLAEALELDVGETVRPWDDLDACLTEADVVVSGTGSEEPIITEQRMRGLLRARRRRPLLLLDIALPRDVEPGVGSLSNVYLYNLDDLQGAVDAEARQKRQQSEQAAQMIHEAVASCMAQIHHRDIGQLIATLRRKLHEVGDAERERTCSKLASASPDQLEQIVDQHTQRVINKILHMPLSQLDQKNPEAPLGFYAAALRRLFDLEHDPAESEGGADASSDQPSEVRHGGD